MTPPEKTVPDESLDSVLDQPSQRPAKPLPDYATAIRAGVTLNGRYRLDRALALGGMGATYMASDLECDPATGLCVPVVVKVPLARFYKSQNILERFRREAEMHQRVEHPGIARLVAVEEIAGDRNNPLRGIPFIVLEFIDGIELHKYIDQAADSLTVGHFLKYLADVAEALEAVHAAGLVHRDVKPRNIMIRRDGSGAILVDFGLALGDDLEALYLSSENFVVSDLLEPSSAGSGTPAYMAPEMWEGVGIGPAADVYGLGIMAYELMTGSYPFTVKKREDFRTVHLESLRVPPGNFNQLFTPRMDQVILGAMQKAPALRHESPRRFIELLREAVHDAHIEGLLLGKMRRESLPEADRPRRPSSRPGSARLERVSTTDWSQEDLKRLRTFQIFHGMSARDVLLLLDAGLQTNFAAGETLFRRGEVGESMFIILEGEVEVFMPAALDDGNFQPGTERVLNRCGPGHVFGELALLLGDTRTASVRAITGVRTLQITQQEVDLIVARPHRASLNLLINLARHVARTLKNSEERRRTSAED